MIAVIDYGVGNLYSLSRSLDSIGAAHIITGDAAQIARADKLILPGVGAFEDAIGRLSDTGLGALIQSRAREGADLLGICLGMQLLFERSYEYGTFEGLGLLAGEIRPIEPDLSEPLKVPHIGWNALHMHRQGRLTKYIAEGDYVYFVHSYYAKSIGDSLIASTDYSVQIPGIVEQGNVMGTQFHPEKSGDVGLGILRAFCEGGTGK